MRVMFRTDASPQLGNGHLSRCLALADALQARGAAVGFVVGGGPGTLAGAVTARGHELYSLPAGLEDWRTDARLTDERLAAGSDWLVVDHYQLDARWEAWLRPRVGRILVIDDLADRPHECELLLDQNLFSDPEVRYRDRVPAHCRLLLGPRYALLRPEFRQIRRQARPRDRGVERIVVYCGGGAGAGLTRRVAAALAGRDYALEVVASGDPEEQQATVDLCRRLGAPCHTPPADLAALLAGADLAVGSGGMTSWERCCLGLPGVVLSVAPNQEPVAAALAEAGAQLYLGRHGQVPMAVLEAAVTLLIANPPLRGLLSRAAAALVDGRGVERVVGAMLPETLTLRPADDADAELMYAWRNHPATRRQSLDSAPLVWEGHRRWLEATLADPDRVLLMGELDGAPVGVLRYDLAGAEAAVSIYLDPERTGQGLGSRLLAQGTAWLARRRPQVQALLARIRPGNQASTAAFLEAGFRLSHSCYRLDLPHEP